MLQPAPCAWPCAEWWISRRMCVRWQTVHEFLHTYADVHLNSCVHLVLVSSLCFYHTQPGSIQQHISLWHTKEHIHSTPAERGTLSVFRPQPEDTNTPHVCHLAEPPPTHRTHSVSFSFNPPAPGAGWHRLPNVYVIWTCERRNICCSNRFHFISTTSSFCP